MWSSLQLTDRELILSILEVDRLYAAYAIGDLEPVMFAQCTWAGASRADRWQALALHYRGLEPPAFFLAGDPNGLRAILETVLCPDRVYITCRAEHLSLAQEFYWWEEVEPMWRMALEPHDLRAVADGCIRLAREHVDDILGLYAHGGGDAFSPLQVELGVFYGILVDGQLVATAGTHLVSPTYGVAAVGNVFTHPDHRGRGYGTAATSAVVTDLLRRGIRDVVLNVARDNDAAIHVYEKLGFRRYCPFIEGRAQRLPGAQALLPAGGAAAGA
jgi:ribosomal protein S18 acetylase RimI-like enzyme